MSGECAVESMVRLMRYTLALAVALLTASFASAQFRPAATDCTIRGRFREQQRFTGPPVVYLLVLPEYRPAVQYYDFTPQFLPQEGYEFRQNSYYSNGFSNRGGVQFSGSR